MRAALMQAAIIRKDNLCKSAAAKRMPCTIPSMSTATMPKVVRQDATVISLVGFAHGTSHFFHLMLPPLFPWFIQEYSASYTAVGGLMTVFFITLGTGQAIAG